MRADWCAVRIKYLEVFAGLLRSDAAAAGVTVTILMFGF